MVVGLFVSTFKFWNIYLKIRITTFNDESAYIGHRCQKCRCGSNKCRYIITSIIAPIETKVLMYYPLKQCDH